jgi:endonuclease/exonuclease/phosphatase family metal-dependent hydrolase
VLTRIDPQTIDRLDIGVPGREPRGAMALKLPLDGHTVRIVATHLGLFPGERRRQTRCLLPMVGNSAASVKILLGDFN